MQVSSIISTAGLSSERFSRNGGYHGDKGRLIMSRTKK